MIKVKYYFSKESNVHTNLQLKRLWVDGLVKMEPGKWTCAALAVGQGELLCFRYSIHHAHEMVILRVQWPGETKTGGKTIVNNHGKPKKSKLYFNT